MWKIDVTPACNVVRMDSNSMNKMDKKFLDDLHATFDFLRSEDAEKPVILTSASKSSFSVGLDFDYCFEIFGRQDLQETAAWFDYFRSAIVKVYSYPAKTIALINGHAFAGGLILALCCDFRIASNAKTRYALNEVSIGIPMPAVYTEIIRRKVGDRPAFDTILTGRVFDELEALQLGFVDRLEAPENLIDAGIREVRKLDRNAWGVYRHTKRLLLAESLNYIRTKSIALDIESVSVITGDKANAAQRAALEKLKRGERLAAAVRI